MATAGDNPSQSNINSSIWLTRILNWFAIDLRSKNSSSLLDNYIIFQAEIRLNLRTYICPDISHSREIMRHIFNVLAKLKSK